MTLNTPHPREGESGFEGYCITMFEGSVWLTRDGEITPDYERRGIWPTFALAQEAQRKALPSDDCERCRCDIDMNVARKDQP